MPTANAIPARLMTFSVRPKAAINRNVPITLIGMARPTTKAPHLRWTEGPFRPNEAVTIELGGCRHRYHCGLARTLHLGPPPAALVELSHVVVEGLDVTLDAVRPGMTCEQVEAVWRSVIGKAGYEKDSRIGYSIGLGYPPDWGEHTASLRLGDTTELAPNMTFHMILGMWMDPVSFVISETFQVTEHGHEVFSNVPRRLFVK